MRRLILALAVLSLAPATASAAAYVIRISDSGTVTKIGPFESARGSGLGKAVPAFGEPDSRREIDSNLCAVRWRSLELTIYFANFGGVPEGKTVCSNRHGFAQTFVARGRRFASWGGVRPGMRSRRVPQHHPDATRHRRSWWLETFVYPFGEDRPSPVVKAAVRRARVTALIGYIGGAGE